MLIWDKIPLYRGFRQVYRVASQERFRLSLQSRAYRQIVEDATHGSGNILDLIFVRPQNFIKTVNNFGQIPPEADNDDIRTQDHCGLTFSLHIGEDCRRL